MAFRARAHARHLRTPLALRLMWRDLRAGRLTLLLLSLVLATGAATGIHIGVERFRPPPVVSPLMLALTIS